MRERVRSCSSSRNPTAADRGANSVGWAMSNYPEPNWPELLRRCVMPGVRVIPAGQRDP